MQKRVTFIIVLCHPKSNGLLSQSTINWKLDVYRPKVMEVRFLVGRKIAVKCSILIIITGRSLISIPHCWIDWKKNKWKTGRGREHGYRTPKTGENIQLQNVYKWPKSPCSRNFCRLHFQIHRWTQVKTGHVELKVAISWYNVILERFYSVTDLNDFSDEWGLEVLIQFYAGVNQHVLNSSISNNNSNREGRNVSKCKILSWSARLLCIRDSTNMLTTWQNVT